jgi:2-aminoadipate transaminase
MFLWLRLPAGMDATALLPRAVEKGVAFVPGLPFYAGAGDARALRLSFVTASVAQIDTGIAALAAAVRESLPQRAAALADALP